MAIGIELLASPNVNLLDVFLETYEQSSELHAQFQKFEPVNAIIIQGPSPGQELPATTQLSTKLDGYDLTCIEQGRKKWVMSLREDVITCTCLQYTRWTSVKATALAAVTPFIAAALESGIKIRATGLQYQDKFRLIGGAGPKTIKELFRHNSKWIPDHLFDQPDYWHNHQGWFSEGYESRRILNNVRVEIAEFDGNDVAGINGQHRMLAVDMDGQSEIPIELEKIDPILDHLHSVNIQLIKGMLSDYALEAINCQEEGGI